MKTVIITGSARGFGLAMLKEFRLSGFNVVMCDINEDAIKEGKKELLNVSGCGEVLTFVGDITKENDVKNIIKKATDKFTSIDIWINNAGVNQEMKPIWEVDEKIINRLIDIDLKGTVICSKEIMKTYIKQGFGAIYNVEGFGSNDATQVGLSIYGTAKRGVTYFTEALSYECEEKNINVIIGKITPGIMITNFINHSLGDDKKFELSDKTKNVYNILGDYPETIAEYVVRRIINNKKNNVKIVWLTTSRAMYRFMKAPFCKRDFFK